MARQVSDAQIFFRRVATALLGTAMFLLPAAAAATTIVSVDTPTATSPVYQPFTVGGWALDTAATQDTGVTYVDVWAYPDPGSGLPPIYLGGASPTVRPDVASIFGPQFSNAGFNLAVRGLAPKTYQLAISAYSAVTHTWSAATTVTIEIRVNPQINIAFRSAAPPLSNRSMSGAGPLILPRRRVPA